MPKQSSHPRLTAYFGDMAFDLDPASISEERSEDYFTHRLLQANKWMTYLATHTQDLPRHPLMGLSPSHLSEVKERMSNAMDLAYVHAVHEAFYTTLTTKTW